MAISKVSIAAQSSPHKNRAGQGKYFAVENAVADLLAVIDHQARE
jgi:hypothetical protein